MDEGSDTDGARLEMVVGESAGRRDLSIRDRKALAAVAAQFFLNGAMSASFIARAPQIRDQISVGLDRFGLLLTVAAFSGLVGSLLAGRVIHAVTTRRVLRVGGVVMVLSLPVIGFATSPHVWLIGMLIYMCVDVLVDISMNLQGSWISSRRHTPVMNRLHGLWSLGTLAGGLGAVAANTGRVSTFAHLVAVAVVVALALIFVTRHLLVDDQEGHRDMTEMTPTSSRTTRLAPLALIVLAGMFAVAAEVTGGDWAAFRLTDDFGAAAALASLAFVAYTVGMTSMRFGGDFLQVRLGQMGLFRPSVLVAAAGIAVASFLNSEPAAIVGFFFFGLGVASFMPGARLPGRRGAGLGAMTAGMRLAYLAAPVVVGALAATSLSVGGAIAVVTIPAMAGLVVVTEWNQRLLRGRARPVDGSS